MDRSVLFDLSEAIFNKDGKGCLNIVEKIYDFGYDLKKACADLLEHIRDLTIVKVTGGEGLELPDVEMERLGALVKGVELDTFQMLFTVLASGYEDISRSVSPRFTFEMALLRAVHLDDVRPISELVEGLEGLKFRLGNPGPRVLASDPPASAKTQTRQGTEGGGGGGQGRRDGSDAAGLIRYIEGKDARNARLVNALKSASISVEGSVVNISTTGSCAVFEMKRESLQALCREYFKKDVKVKVESTGVDTPTPDDTVLKEARRILGGRVLEPRRRVDV